MQHHALFAGAADLLLLVRLVDAAAIEVPAQHEAGLQVVGVAVVTVDVVADAGAALGHDLRAELGARGVHLGGGRVDVAARHVDARVVDAGKAYRVVERARQCFATEPGCFALVSGLPTVLKKRIFACSSSSLASITRDWAAVDSLLGLLAICVGQSAALDALADVAKDRLMNAEILGWPARGSAPAADIRGNPARP